MKSNRIASNVEAIKNVVMHQLPPSRKTATVAAVRRGSMVMMLGENGKIYISGCWSYGITVCATDVNIDDFLFCLRTLGVITKNDCAAHREYAGGINEKRSRKYNAMLLRNSTERIGLTLTAAQKKRLAKYLQEEDGEVRECQA